MLSASYASNGDGVLVQARATRYTQDFASPLSQILNDGTANYIYGLDRLTSSAGTWYLGDALGSVRQTLDASGSDPVLHTDPTGKAPPLLSPVSHLHWWIARYLVRPIWMQVSEFMQ